MISSNPQPTKELQYFQRILVQNQYIKYLNNACDHLDWEREKMETLVEMKDAEISELKKSIGAIEHDRNKITQEFKEYAKKVKASKFDSGKVENQRLKIIQLTTELEETTKRLHARNRMVEILEKQQKRKL